MRLARVEGVASPVRKIKGIEGSRIVIVSFLGDSSGAFFAVGDPLHAAVGDHVLVTEGRAAGATLVPSNPESSRLDAAIVAIVRPEEVNPRLFD